MCGYNFTNDEIVKMAIPVPRLSKYVYNHIILFNEGDDINILTKIIWNGMKVRNI